MKNECIISDQILKSIEIICKKIIEKEHIDRIYTGVVCDVTDNGYTVAYGDIHFNIKTSATDVYNVGEQVRVCIPGNNKRRAFIVMDIDAVQRMINMNNE